MKKRILTDDELNQVITLKQRGYSWLRIQKETQIPRLIAKNAHQIWINSRAMEELKAARMNVATHEFQRHLDNICVVAMTLMENLPTCIYFSETKNANEIIDRIWQRDIYQKGDECGTPTDLYNRKSEREQHYILRENKLLLESLQAHTREKVRWQALQEWKVYWDNCLQYQSTLKEETNKLLLNIIKDREKEIQKKLSSREQGMAKLTKMIAEGVNEVIWHSAIDGEIDGAFASVKNQLSKDGIFHIFLGLVDIALKDMEASELVKNICIQLIKIICTGDIPQRVLDCNRVLKARVDELEMSLSEVILRPLILRTRCELCPA